MNSTLTNGLALLMRLAESPRPHTIKELAQAAELPPSHVHRLLQTLVEAKYVDKGADRRYAIGLGALRLGHALLLNTPVRQRAVPAMLDLARQLELAVTLAMPFGDAAISIAFVSHDGRVRPFDETLGRVLGATTSASGKLFLASLDPAARDARLDRLVDELPAARLDAVRRELGQIVSDGYSLKPAEPGEQGTFGIAVPIHDADRVVTACLGLSGPPPRFTPAELPALLRAMRGVVEQIEDPQPRPEPVA